MTSQSKIATFLTESVISSFFFQIRGHMWCIPSLFPQWNANNFSLKTWLDCIIQCSFSVISGRIPCQTMLTSIGAQCMDILKHICFQLHNSFLLHRLFVLHERSTATETLKFKIKFCTLITEPNYQCFPIQFKLHQLLYKAIIVFVAMRFIAGSRYEWSVFLYKYCLPFGE